MSVIKTPEQQESARKSGEILARAVAVTLAAVRPGVTTADLDDVFRAEVAKTPGAEPSFLGYQDYPRTICTSINNEVVHGIPSKERVLQEGDIIGVDCGVRYEEMCTDMARTVAVGEVSDEARKLINVTRESFLAALKYMKPGNTTGDIGAAVQAVAEQPGYGVVRVLVGHGVGESVHEPPEIPNFGTPGTGVQLEEGMIIAVEPMVNIGGPEVEFDQEDGWTVRTADGSLSSHYEETMIITADGPERITHIDGEQ